MLSSTPVNLKIGRHILDVLNPKPELIDLDAIEDALWSTRRFSGNPRALTIRQHTSLVEALALRLNAAPAVVRWCWHHDDHEGIIGDIPGPLKHFLNLAAIQGNTTTLDEIEIRLDAAICTARGIAFPDSEVRKKVHFFDKLAETLEWRFVLNEPQAIWNQPYRNWLSEDEALGFVDQATARERAA